MPFWLSSETHSGRTRVTVTAWQQTYSTREEASGEQTHSANWKIFLFCSVRVDSSMLRIHKIYLFITNLPKIITIMFQFRYQLLYFFPCSFRSTRAYTLYVTYFRRPSSAYVAECQRLLSEFKHRKSFTATVFDKAEFITQQFCDGNWLGSLDSVKGFSFCHAVHKAIAWRCRRMADEGKIDWIEWNQIKRNVLKLSYSHPGWANGKG